MAIIYASPLKDKRLQLVSDLLAGKAAAASIGTATAGKLVIGTAVLSGGTGVLVSIDLPTTPFTIGGGVATLAGVPLSGTASATGTAAKAELRDFYGNVIVAGLTVGMTGTHITIASTSIVEGGDVIVTGGTIVHG